MISVGGGGLEWIPYDDMDTPNEEARGGGILMDPRTVVRIGMRQAGNAFGNHLPSVADVVVWNDNEVMPWTPGLLRNLIRRMVQIGHIKQERADQIIGALMARELVERQWREREEQEKYNTRTIPASLYDPAMLQQRQQAQLANQQISAEKMAKLQALTRKANLSNPYDARYQAANVAWEDRPDYHQSIDPAGRSEPEPSEQD